MSERNDIVMHTYEPDGKLRTHFLADGNGNTYTVERLARIVAETLQEKPAQDTQKRVATMKDIAITGLVIEGEHHKQWALWRIAELLGLDTSEIDAEKGIAP